MALETFTGTAPAHWAPYLINGDPSAIADEEIALADRFVAWLGGPPCDVGESYFAYRCDAPGVRLAGDMALYTALVDTSPEERQVR